MKRKYLLGLWTIAALAGFLWSSAVFGQATLKHSYTFEDGTANDVVGTAHGTIIGGTISDGVYTAGTNGDIIELPGPDIAINTYSALTIEAYVVGSENAATNSMLFYMGGSVNNLGAYGFFLTPWHWRNGTQAGISTVNESQPWNGESYVLATENTLRTAGMHHAVVIINSTDIIMYLDAQLIGTTSLAEQGNSISALSNDFAWIGRGGYTSDPTWIGSLDKFDIYEGELDRGIIVQHASDFLGIPMGDATLSSITTSKGEVEPEFDPETLEYELWVPYGITTVDIDVEPTVSGVIIEMYDGLGNVIPEDGVVSWNIEDEGIDVEILVTALDGATQISYFLSIFNEPSNEVANLSDIQFSAGSLTTDFDPDTLHYVAIVPYGSTSVDVTGVPVWEGATVTGDGTITLTEGTGSATIVVTSENGANTKTYTVDIFVTRFTTGKDFYILNEASSASFDPGLVVGEEADTYIYLTFPEKDNPSQLFQFEESGVEGQYFLKNKLNHYLALVPAPVPGSEDQDWNLEMVETLRNNLDSCRFVLNEFEPGRFRVQAVARFPLNHYDMGPNSISVGQRLFSDKWPDNALATWSLEFPEDVIPPYDTYLDTLYLDVAGLSPDFAFYTTNYTVTLPVGTTSMTVTAIPNDPTSTVTGTGVIDVSDGQGMVTITVTASEPGYTRDYFIRYQVDSPLTLKHSYTFADGTAQDQEGDVDGVVHGGTITEGIFTSAIEGDYISFSGEELALNTYPSITLEAYVTTGANAGWTMLAYFGGQSGSHSYWMSIARNDDVSRTALDINGGDEDGVNGLEPGPGESHHYVSVLTNDTIYWYVDGVLTGKMGLRPTHVISEISTAGAWLGFGGWNDPTWIGSVLEFNIYAGQMDAQTVALRSVNFPLEDATSDATLSDLMVDGVTVDDFVSYNLSYDVDISGGTTVVPAVTATATNANATVVVTPAAELPGTTTVVVTAQDGETTVTYSVNFIPGVSDIATLADLTVDGTTVEGFDPEDYSYDVTLPYGTTTVPTVAGTPTDANASVVVTPASSLPGTTSVVVTAEDGTTKKTYSVNFELETSVEAPESFRVNVYPTVSDGTFRVVTSGGLYTISVYDISGIKVLQKTGEANEQIITVKNAGMYIVKVESEGASRVFKVFKTH